MKIDEKSLDKIAGGLKTVELKDGSFAIVADSAEVYSSAEEAQKAIDEIEKNWQFGGPRFHHGHHGPHGGKHHKHHHGPFQGPSEHEHPKIGHEPHMN